MIYSHTSNRNFEALAWGALFVWWGITALVPSLPDGSLVTGSGLILIGVNIARWFNGVPVSRFSITLGILALVWGGLELARVLFRLPFELPIFAILLIVLGVLVVVPGLPARRNE